MTPESSAQPRLWLRMTLMACVSRQGIKRMPSLYSATFVCYSDLLFGCFIHVCRYLDAFNVCCFGEARAYTNPKVSDQYPYLRKAEFFSLDVYDVEHRKYGRFLPGFKFVEIPGASLNVVGVLKRQASLDAIEETMKDPSCVAMVFFTKILNRAISCLPLCTRTRRNNLTQTSQQHLPRYYRLYSEDIPDLSLQIRIALRSLPCDEQYTFYFVYVKLGQQQQTTLPLTLHGLNLDMVIADVRKIEYSSCHLAINLSHMADDYSLFWDATRTAIFLKGKRVVKYPVMGLGEIGNITSNFPRGDPIRKAWRIQSREYIHVTFAQAYTPLTKPMDTRTPFHDHPFLISFLLGRDCLRGHKDFHHIMECTEGRKEYHALCESIVMQLTRATAR